MKAAVESYLAAAHDLLNIRQPDAARAQRIGSSTLQRGLRREGVSWRELKDAERKRRCDAVLAANPRACTRRLSQRCGLGRQSLHASFLRWYGTTPAKLRADRVAAV